MTATTQTVREIALENSACIRVFEKFGIDYCCGGRKPLAEACDATSLAVDEVIAALEQALDAPVHDAKTWSDKPLSELITHIVSSHHAYVNREVPRLAQLAARVVSRHGDDKPELRLLESKVAELGEELLQHLGKEEMILFPYINAQEKAITDGTAKPNSCFGTVASPLEMMTREHDSAGTLMAEIRRLRNNYTPPVGACPTFLNYFNTLQEFEQDLHQHIHLENNILFPRAIVIENATA